MVLDDKFRADIEDVVRKTVDAEMSHMVRRLMLLFVPAVFAIAGWLITVEVRTRENSDLGGRIETTNKKFDGHTHPEITAIKQQVEGLQREVRQQQQMLGRIDERVSSLKEDTGDIKKMLRDSRKEREVTR